MYSFKELLNLPEEEQINLGTIFTANEIAQQPEIWIKTSQIVIQNRKEIKAFLSKSGVYSENEMNIYLTGAGSSEFVGNAVAPFLQKAFNRPVTSVPTTDFITQPDYYLMNNKKNLVVSIGRSGNSPESVATYNKTKEYNPSAMQVNLCCNKDSEMLRLTEKDENTLNIILPEETNDSSLVMTSSYTSMALALLALPFLDDVAKFEKYTQMASKAAQKILENDTETVRTFICRETDRILYLGTAELKGCAQESRLKSQEMTDGRILSDFNSYLGLRHGPQVFANKTSLVIAYLSSDPKRRLFEIDLLKEMQEKEQGADYLFVCDKKDKAIQSLKGQILEVFPGGDSLPDAFNILPYVLIGQLNGLFKSIQIGHKPDSPSISGTINRVVQDVSIY
ncbi:MULTISPECIES: SIS domain-containing protein [unclassified Oceanispirochaeta]|uniref:SIS domain-containing protein n=1 Tax=unclassified Oceanispirochaeta TaxID=2635722 RepID=UPI000E08EAB2|nr:MULTISPECIES: SIS domain-containing protein [unclassified Oceanispirochaeta]MBF9014635.1 SIS domain-containing protein [Oceanispirochaeta sp. M2]NPD70891.1 SIS domain-containing protein [Oceanispirochaeta sp. M1]RDG34171.1 SIS domain-containing protein [Oceanispirochaeta sp. M1]